MYDMTFANIHKLINASSLISPAQATWVAGQIQSTMVFEALRKEPNPMVIGTLNKLLDSLRDEISLPAWESVVNNLPQFRKDTELAKADPESRSATLRTEAEEECIRRATAGFAPMPRDAADAKKAIDKMMIDLAEKKLEEKQRFLDAVEYVEECCATFMPKAALDDVEIAENILGNIYNSFYSELEKMLLKSMQLKQRVRLNPWQEQQLRTLMASCSTLAQLLGVTLDKVEQSLRKTENIARAAFKTAAVIEKVATDDTDEEDTQTTIDNPPKAARKRKPKDVVDNTLSRMGVDSDSLGAANAVMK